MVRPVEVSGTIGTAGFEALANGGDFFDSPCDTVDWGFTVGPQWRGIAGTVAATYTPYAPVSATDYDWAYGQPLGDVVVRIDDLVMEPLTEDLHALTAQERSLEAAHATLWVPAR